MKTVVLGDLEHELAGTKRVLERLPEDQLGWKPHDKSWSLGELAIHVANLPGWMLTILTTDELDLKEMPPRLGEPTSSREIMQRFEENAASLREAVSGTSDEEINQEWTLRHGNHVISRQRRGSAMRGMGISHMIHHRAQLGVYLRMLDVPVPGLYGPSADE